jgi:tRNA threonylcarbamoyladenosine biosynthesis protein TsaB
MPMIENVLNVAECAVADLDAVAVNAGPGSFTGVRIGVSAVKGLAFTNDLPCISVSTLEAMAENTAAVPGAVICCLMDARCQQVYGALFEKETDGALRRLSEDEALTIPQMAEKLSGFGRPIVLVGDGSEMCYRAWKDSVEGVYLAPASTRYQNAAATAVIAERLLSENVTVSAGELQPVYLRLPQAERELNARLNK